MLRRSCQYSDCWMDKAGQDLFEYRCHRVSANASETQPAKLLAVLVVNTNETELTFPFGTEFIPFVRRYCRGNPAELPFAVEMLLLECRSPVMGWPGGAQQLICWKKGARYGENLP